MNKMLFDVYEGLSEEYRQYGIIEPNQLNFREAANDSERMTAAELRKDLNKDSSTLFVSGGIIIVIGILCTFSNLGGILAIMFGLLIVYFGIMKVIKSKRANLVATGIVVKKESYAAGSVSNNTRRSFRWLVIDVDGIENTLCVVHCSPENFLEIREGDRILVINDNSIHFGKKIA